MSLKCRPLAYWSAFVVSLGGFIQSYAACAIAGALLFIGREFSLSPIEEGLAASSILLGALFGSLFAGQLADRFGRRAALLFSAVLYILSSAPLLWVSAFSSFIAFRFLCGIAAGVTSLTVPLYLAEIAEPKERGAFVALFQLAVTIGTLVAYFVNFKWSVGGDWRVMLAIAALPALLQGIAGMTVPESPKWLFGRGRIEEGSAVLKRLGNKAPSKEEKHLASFSKRGFFSSRFAKGFLVGAALVVFQQWCGINAIVYFTPKIFLSSGFSDAKEALRATLGLGVVNFIANMASLFLVDRMGRRKLILISAGGVSISLFFFTMALGFQGHPLWAVVLLVSYLLSYSIGFGPIPWVIVSEIYPLAIRARAIALMTFLSWLSNFSVVFTFPRFLEACGPVWTFGAYFLCAGVSWLVFYRAIPETKGRSLEQIEKELY